MWTGRMVGSQSPFISLGHRGRQGSALDIMEACLGLGKSWQETLFSIAENSLEPLLGVQDV